MLLLVTQTTALISCCVANANSWLICSIQDGEIPWLSIVRSGPVWAIITAHTCNNWANYTILICIPMYMKEVLKFDVKQVPEIRLRYCPAAVLVDALLPRCFSRHVAIRQPDTRNCSKFCKRKTGKLP